MTGPSIVYEDATGLLPAAWTQPAEITLSPREAAALPAEGRGHTQGIRHAVSANRSIETILPEP